MIGYILAAIGGALAADIGVKAATGKYAHEYLFEWWCKLRDYVAGWLRDNAHLGIQRIGLVVLDCFDEVAVRTKKMADRITLGLFGVDAQRNGYDICTQEVTIEEALAQFPALRENPMVLEELQ